MATTTTSRGSFNVLKDMGVSAITGVGAEDVIEYRNGMLMCKNYGFVRIHDISIT